MAEMTPAEITRLERDIAEGVMRWHWCPSCTALMQDGLWLDEDGDDAAPWDWSPWNDERAALAVLERLEAILVAEQEGPEPPGWTVKKYKWGGVTKYGVTMATFRAQASGPHFGPAVCELARKVMEGR